MFRPIQVDHTNCLQVAIKKNSFIQPTILYLTVPALSKSFQNPSSRGSKDLEA
jgi:hypothetical protein